MLFCYIANIVKEYPATYTPEEIKKLPAKELRAIKTYPYTFGSSSQGDIWFKNILRMVDTELEERHKQFIRIGVLVAASISVIALWMNVR